jgi:hypothetical protein
MINEADLGVGFAPVHKPAQSDQADRSAAGPGLNSSLA